MIPPESQRLDHIVFLGEFGKTKLLQIIKADLRRKLGQYLDGRDIDGIDDRLADGNITMVGKIRVLQRCAVTVVERLILNTVASVIFSRSSAGPYAERILNVEPGWE